MDHHCAGNANTEIGSGLTRAVPKPSNIGVRCPWAGCDWLAIDRHPQHDYIHQALTKG